jgi:hypothetical protein
MSGWRYGPILSQSKRHPYCDALPSMISEKASHVNRHFRQQRKFLVFAVVVDIVFVVVEVVVVVVVHQILHERHFLEVGARMREGPLIPRSVMSQHAEINVTNILRAVFLRQFPSDNKLRTETTKRFTD